MKLSQEQVDKIQVKVLMWNKIFYILLLCIAVSEGWTYYTGNSPSFLKLLVFTYSFILIVEIIPSLLYKINIVTIICPIIVVVAEAVTALYYPDIYQSPGHQLFLFIYFMCLTKLVSEAVKPDKNDAFTKNAIIIVLLISLGVYYTQVEYGQQEWVGLVLLLLGTNRIMASLALYFVLMENKKHLKKI